MMLTIQYQAGDMAQQLKVLVTQAWCLKVSTATMKHHNKKVSSGGEGLLDLDHIASHH